MFAWYTAVVSVVMSGGPQMGAPEPHGTPRLSPATGNQANVRVAAGDLTAAVWEDDRAGGPDLWGIRVNADGTVPIPFGDRVASSGQPSAPAIAAGPGLWLVTWLDGVRDTQTVRASLRAADGAELSERLILSLPGAFTPPSSAWTGSGFVTVWADLQAPQLVGARVETDGRTAVVNMSTPSDADSASVACGDGTCLVLFISPGDRWDVLGRFFDPATLEFTSPEILIAGTPADEIWPTVAFNQAAGVFVMSWWDKSAGDVMVGSIPSDGQGVVISRVLEGTAAEESQPDVSCSAAGLDLCAVALRGADATEVHLWRISGDLASLDAGPQVWPSATYAVHAPSVSLGRNAGMVAWHGPSPGDLNGDDVYGVALDGNGVAVAQVQLLSAAANAQRFPHLARQGDQHWLLWRDDARSPGLANYQAAVGGPGKWVLDDLDVSAGAESYDRGVVVPLEADALAVWGDDGPSGLLNARRIAPRGGMGPTELALTGATGCYGPAGVSLNGVGWIASWCNGSGVWLTSYAGNAFGEARLVSGGASASVEPALETDGRELRLVWSDDRSGDPDLFGARIDPAGGVLDGTGVPLVVAPGAQRRPTVAFSEGVWLVAWEDERGGGKNVLAQRFGADWTPLDSAPIAVEAVDGERCSPRALGVPGGFLVTWETLANRGDVMAATVNLDGKVGEPFAIAASPDWEGEVSLANGAVKGEVVVAYSAFDPGEQAATRRVFTRTLSLLQEPIPPGIFELGCDCSAGGGGGSLLWWGLGALAALWPRRLRRSTRARRR
jgi:MYXO-CTERM domain-containing protein